MSSLSNTTNKKSMMSIFSSMDDPRKPYNQKHKFMNIVAIVILATLAGADSWDEMVTWANSQIDWLKTFLSLENGIPSHDTLNRVFQMIDPEQLHSAFREWTAAIAKNLKGVVAIDGKTIRRSRETTSNTKPVHIVSAWATELSLVLGQTRTDVKSNEITAIPKLLNQLEIAGCIVTIDAMGTQHAIADKIISKSADYILCLKENQEQLYQDVKLYFETEVFTKPKSELEKDNCYYKNYCNEHGRYELREYYIVHDVSWMQQRTEWNKLNAIGARHSRVEENGVITEHTQYMIISRKNMSAEEFGKSQRGHWGIENSLHWCLDIAFSEDSCRKRAGNAAENMNVIRHLCTNLLKQEKTCKLGLKGKRKKCGWEPDYMCKVLTTIYES